MEERAVGEQGGGKCTRVQRTLLHLFGSPEEINTGQSGERGRQANLSDGRSSSLWLVLLSSSEYDNCKSVATTAKQREPAPSAARGTASGGNDPSTLAGERERER